MTKTYEEGITQGRLDGHEDRLDAHSARMDSHSSRIRPLERVAWMALGAFVFIEVLPRLLQFAQGVP